MHLCLGFRYSGDSKHVSDATRPNRGSTAMQPCCTAQNYQPLKSMKMDGFLPSDQSIASTRQLFTIMVEELNPPSIQLSMIQAYPGVQALSSGCGNAGFSGVPSVLVRLALRTPTVPHILLHLLSGHGFELEKKDFSLVVMRPSQPEPRPPAQSRCLTNQPLKWSDEFILHWHPLLRHESLARCGPFKSQKYKMSVKSPNSVTNATLIFGIICQLIEMQTPTFQSSVTKQIFAFWLRRFGKALSSWHREEFNVRLCDVFQWTFPESVGTDSPNNTVLEQSRGRKRYDKRWRCTIKLPVWNCTILGAFNWNRNFDSRSWGLRGPAAKGS